MNPAEAHSLAGIRTDGVTPMHRRGYPPVGVRTWRDGLPLMREVGADKPLTAAQGNRIIGLLERIDAHLATLARKSGGWA